MYVICLDLSFFFFCLETKTNIPFYFILLVYLLHAYDYSPSDPLICLCLAIASIGRAMQRQSDNRHHLVIQVSFFFTFWGGVPFSYGF